MQQYLSTPQAPELSSDRNTLVGSQAVRLASGLVLFAGVSTTPVTALCSDPGPTSMGTINIAVTIEPRVQNLSFKVSEKGAAIKMYANFEGRFERFSKSAKRGYKTTAFKVGEQSVLVEDGDLIVFRPQ